MLIFLKLKCNMGNEYKGEKKGCKIFLLITILWSLTFENNNKGRKFKMIFDEKLNVDSCGIFNWDICGILIIYSI